MRKLQLFTTCGWYTVFYSNGEHGSVEIYRGSHGRIGQIGDLVIGSVPSLPENGGYFEEGEYVLSKDSAQANQVRQTARQNDATSRFNYAVIRDMQGNTRVLPRTREVKDGLTKRITIAEKSQPKA